MLWKAGNIKKFIATATCPTISGTTSTLESYFTTGSTGAQNIQGRAKNVTIAIPDSAVDIVNFLGVDANGFQNAELEAKPFSGGGMSGTLVLDDIDVLEALFYGTATSITGGLSRYQAGKLTSAGRPRIALLLHLENLDASKKLSFVLNNANISKLGDVKISGPDSHFEVEFEAICLPKDFYFERK
jgi:hypothetical protein